MSAIKFKVSINILHEIARLCLIIFLLALLVFCWWYVTTGYDTISSWYLGLNSCFYRVQYWKTDFFTPEVKSKGNLYCFAAIAIIIPAILWAGRSLIRSFRLPRQIYYVTASPARLLQLSLCIIVPFLFWLWGTAINPPSNDEVFSGFNCAGIHPFQNASYYMLPNNHVFFNLLNNILFHAAENKVESGRVLSLLVYCTLVLVYFSLFESLLKNSWLALIVALGMSIQFPTWAFGCQNRGYELLTLCEWLTFLSFIKYTQQRDRRWLYFMAIVSAIGYFTIPIFMYIDAAIFLFAGCMQLRARKIDWQFWLFQLAAALLTFLFYLPSIAISGLPAITANPWVTIHLTFPLLWASLPDTCHEFMDYTFCNNGDGYYLISLALFLLPLTLIFYKSNRIARMLGWFFLCMWITVILFVIKMRLFPMDRAMQGQFTITYALVIYALYLALSSLSKKLNAPLLPGLALTLFLVVLGINYAYRGKKQIVHYPCHFNSVAWYQLLSGGINTYFPRGCSVACSDESFYLYYLCWLRGYDITKCPRGNEQYYVKLPFEPFVNAGENDYTKIGTTGDFYIYKRK